MPARPTPAPAPAPTPGRTDWFIHDRFGLFVHWGLYALPARHEWVKSRERLSDAHYQRYFDRFDPDLYDPAAWARLAVEAGMRYAVLTSKHHDGFCLWDSALTDYKATNTPAGRDLLREFVDAFRAAGLKIGFYHSLIDWHHPEFPIAGFHPQRDDRAAIAAARGRDIRAYAEYLHGQVRELLTNYGRIDILWLDFSYADRPMGEFRGKGKDDWQSERLIAMARALQPGILINNRAEIAQDFVTPEQFQPRRWLTAGGQPVVWEACQTLNGSWGYDRDNLDWKSPELLLRMLIDTVSKGGNLLLNVGPTARGEIDERAQATLRALGGWLRRHGRAIYGATQSSYPVPAGVDGRVTQRGDRLYLHLFAWPFKHVHLDGLAGQVAYAQLLNDGSEIPFLEGGGAGDGANTSLRDVGPDTLTLVLPVQPPPVAVPVIELFLK
jgi:alpha-L-fucosidase